MGNKLVTMTIGFYGKGDDDEWKKDFLLPATELSYFQHLFGESSDNPMYDCFVIGSKEKVELEKKFGFVIDTDSYDCFLEYRV